MQNLVAPATSGGACQATTSNAGRSATSTPCRCCPAGPGPQEQPRGDGLPGRADPAARERHPKQSRPRGTSALNTAAGHRQDPGADHCAGVGRMNTCQPGQLRLLRPHGGQPASPTAEEGRGQRQVRQQAPGLGLHRGGVLLRCATTRRSGAGSRSMRQDFASGGHQGRGAQAGAGLLSCVEDRRAVRRGQRRLDEEYQ